MNTFFLGCMPGVLFVTINFEFEFMSKIPYAMQIFCNLIIYF